MSFKYKIIDLSHNITATSPTWDNKPGFDCVLEFDYQDCTTPVKFRKHFFNMSAGIGTHIDAPAHCIPDGATIEQLNLTNLISPCIMIDLSGHAHESYQVSVDDVIKFEETYGIIPKNSFVIFYTGWSKLWDQSSKYHNNLQFPCVSESVAQLLIKRNIAGLGTDTLSPDIPKFGAPVHEIILGAGKYIVENIVHAEKLPATGSFIGIFPVKVTSATEAPARVVGFIA